MEYLTLMLEQMERDLEAGAARWHPCTRCAHPFLTVRPEGKRGRWPLRCSTCPKKAPRAPRAPEQRACERCATPYTPPPRGGHSRFCTRACAAATRIEAKPQRSVECRECSAVFGAPRGSGPVAYCAPECRRAAINRYRRETGLNSRSGTARRAREAGALTDDHTHAELLDSWEERELFVCVLNGPDCEGAPETMEHLIPLSRGGDHTVGNLAPACTRCNSQKTDRTLEEWHHHVQTLREPSR